MGAQIWPHHTNVCKTRRLCMSILFVSCSQITFKLHIFSVERIHSRGQHPCKFMGTREIFYIWRVQLPQDLFGTPIWPPWNHVNTLSHVDGFSLNGPSSFWGWSRHRAKSSEVNENEMTSWGKSLYRPGLMRVITYFFSTILVTPVTKNPILWSLTSSISWFSRHFRLTRAFHVSVW